jgi:ElaB/YqjD/DUF883 family membrane-anchored ribosome-binding protein
MTDPYASESRADDIEDGDDTASARLDREADAILQREGMSSGARPLREALREDAALVRDWGRERTQRLKGAVDEEPLRAVVWALGLGVLIGLLAAR